MAPRSSAAITLAGLRTHASAAPGRITTLSRTGLVPRSLDARASSLFPNSIEFAHPGVAPARNATTAAGANRRLENLSTDAPCLDFPLTVMGSDAICQKSGSDPIFCRITSVPRCLPPNYERLVTLKKKYDPCNVLRSNKDLRA